MESFRPVVAPSKMIPRAIAWSLAALASVWLLVQLWPILIMFVAALILVGTLNPVVSALERRRLSRHLAVALVFIALFVGGAATGFLTLPALGAQLTAFVKAAPDAQARLAAVLGRWQLTAGWAHALGRVHASDLLSPGEHAFAYTRTAVELIGGGATIIVLALYLLADRDRTRGALYAVIPRRFHVRLARVLINLEVIVGGYMRGQLITSAAMAAFVFALLSVFRVPGALALAVFAGLVDVIPFIGVLLACGPAVAAAYLRSPTAALIVAVALFAYQEFESRLLIPRIYGKALRLPPTAVVMALLIGGKLLGIAGALLALPIAAGLRMLIEELRVELPGDDTNDEALRERDEVAEEAYAERSAGKPADQAAEVATAIAKEIRDEDVAGSTAESEAEAESDAAEVPITDGRH